MPKLTAALSVLVLLLPGTILISDLPTVSAATTYGSVSVQGSIILVNGQIPVDKFYGVVDTTMLQYAILTYIDGQTQYAGKSSVFNGPDTGNYGAVSPNDTAAHFFDRYFALLSYYHCNLVRVGAGDIWGTGILYEAWTNHQDDLISLLKTMDNAAEAHNVWIVPVLAGSTEYPAYAFGGTGSVFNNTTSAYQNYISYSNGMMSSLDGLAGIAWFDVFNEPDHNACYADYWSTNGGKTAFHGWASSVANDTADASGHPRTMGVAGLGDMFGWGKDDFDLCTGTVPFEIASRHYYASNSDTYIFATPETWAKADSKPLYWSELAYNAVYPLVRYTFAEQAIFANGGQAITTMVLTGTAGYPLGVSTVPRASFTVSPVQGGSSTNFQVDASSCSDPQDASSVLQVRWDWTNDGTYDTPWTTAKTATHSYPVSGTYVIGLEVMNSIGLTNTTSRTVVVADELLLSITSPANGAYQNTTSVTVQWNSNYPSSGIASYSIRLDGGTWTQLAPTTTSYIFNGLAQGSHTITVRSVTNTGNVKDASVTFVVDSIAPALTITSPSSGSTLTSTSVTVRWSGSDSGSGVAYYQVRTSSSPWTQLASTATSYTFSGLGQGPQIVTVRAVDRAGNAKDSAVTFTVDTAAPSLTLSYPSSGSYVNTASPTVRWSGGDAGSGVSYYMIRRDGGSWAQLASTTTSYTYSYLAQGRHTVTVRAVDKVGNVQQVSTTFTVDSVAPTLRITAPSNGASFSSTSVTVRWSGSDGGSGLAAYYVRLDNGGWTQLSSTTTSYTFTGLGHSGHTVTVRAVDRAGNVRDVTVSFRVR
jgi:hypothetical protein